MRSMITGMQNYRQAVSAWKQELPKESASKVFEELKEQTAVLLDKRAEAWLSENKLIHAGAAQKLADQLRSK
jgi:hypothetical protein